MGRKSEFSREERIAAVKPETADGRSLLSAANEYVRTLSENEGGTPSIPRRDLRQSLCRTRPVHRRTSSRSCTHELGGSEKPRPTTINIVKE